MKAICFGLAAGAAVQGFRNYPPDGTPTSDAVMVLFVVGLLLAYLAGRARRGSSSVAVASASAEAEATATAQNHVQVAVVVPGGGAGAASAGRHVAVPVDGALPSWLGAPDQVFTLDQLDGQDAAELASVLDVEGERA